MLLDVRNLSGGYKGIGIVDTISFTLPEGGALALLGRNGVGKTTLLRLIMGLADRTHGEVMVDGAPMPPSSPAALARAGITFVPDTRGVFARLTVLENIRLAQMHAYRPQSIDVFELLPDLQARSGQTAGTLSGGLQQQVAIARALATGAKLIIIDELTQGLQPSIVKALVGALDNARKSGIGLILVDQNPQLALGICDTVAVMDHGQIAITGRSDALMNDNRLTDLLVV